MPNQLSNKVSTNQSGVNGISSQPETNETQSVTSPKATQPNVIKSSKAGTISLGLGSALTAGLAVGGLVAGFSSIPGIILLIAASVGATILVAALAIMHFGPRKAESTTTVQSQPPVSNADKTTSDNAIVPVRQEIAAAKKEISQPRKEEIEQYLTLLYPHGFSSDKAEIRIGEKLTSFLEAPEELQYILDKYGPNIQTIDLDRAPFSATCLDISNCSNLLSLNLKDQHDLGTLIGLRYCENLNYLNLDGCGKIGGGSLLTC